MTRVLAVAVAVLMVAALGVSGAMAQQPKTDKPADKPMDQKLDKPAGLSPDKAGENQGDRTPSASPSMSDPAPGAVGGTPQPDAPGGAGTSGGTTPKPPTR